MRFSGNELITVGCSVDTAYMQRRHSVQIATLYRDAASTPEHGFNGILCGSPRAQRCKGDGESAPIISHSTPNPHISRSNPQMPPNPRVSAPSPPPNSASTVLNPFACPSQIPALAPNTRPPSPRPLIPKHLYHPQRFFRLFAENSK